MLTDWERRQLAEIERGLLDDLPCESADRGPGVRVLLRDWIWPAMRILALSIAALVVELAVALAAFLTALALLPVFPRLRPTCHRLRDSMRAVLPRWPLPHHRHHLEGG